MLPIVDDFIEWCQKGALDDPLRAEDIDDDHVFIDSKIFLRNLIRSIRLTG